GVLAQFADPGRHVLHGGTTVGDFRPRQPWRRSLGDQGPRKSAFGASSSAFRGTLCQATCPPTAVGSTEGVSGVAGPDHSAWGNGLRGRRRSRGNAAWWPVTFRWWRR